MESARKHPEAFTPKIETVGKFYLFGSRAEGKERDGSDYDIIFFPDNPIKPSGKTWGEASGVRRVEERYAAAQTRRGTLYMSGGTN